MLPDFEIRVLEDAETMRRIVQVSHFALGPRVARRIMGKSAKYPGGIHDPVFKADYLLDLKAQPGDTVYKNFGVHNIARCTPEPDKYPQLLALDFGFSPDPTAILAIQITPQQLQVYFEHVMGGATARVHKARLRQGLMSFEPFHGYTPTPGGTWSNIFEQFTAIGDVSGAGFIAEYSEEPDPLMIGPPSVESGWRDREGSEGILDGLLRPLKRCCWHVWLDEYTHCPECRRELEVIPGVLIDPSCIVLREEIPTQVVDENGKRPKGNDHTVDALLYAGRYAMSLQFKAEPKKKQVPYYLKQPSRELENEDPEIVEMYGSNPAVVRFFR